MLAWKVNTNKTIRAMTAEEAKASLAKIREAGSTIDVPEVRRITGGYASQSINVDVIRRLAFHAGIIKFN